MVQYGRYGMSSRRRYYHLRRQSKRPRYNICTSQMWQGRAKVAFRDRSPACQREHVEHFINTLDDRELEKQLTLLRLHDANTMENFLHAYQRMSFRQKRVPAESKKFRSRSAKASAPVYSKSPWALKAIRKESEESGSESSSNGSNEEESCRKVCVTTASDQVADPGEQQDRSRNIDRGDDRGRIGLSKV